MNTAYDNIMRVIQARGFRNRRLEEHSVAMSRGILRHLRATCEPFADDMVQGRVSEWFAFPSPARRSHKLDLAVAEPNATGDGPDLDRLYHYKPEYAIRGTGYVVDSLEAALWCFVHSESFGNAILEAADLGDDVNTTAAVCGQVAGAYYGASKIAAHWLEQLALRAEITELADRLYEASRKGGLSRQCLKCTDYLLCPRKAARVANSLCRAIKCIATRRVGHGR